MRRRDLIINTAGGALAAGLTPAGATASEGPKDSGSRTDDKWLQLGTGKMGLPERKKTCAFDVAV